MTDSSKGTTLDCQPLRQLCVVAGVDAPAAAPEWKQWLEEIGFMPGEKTCIVTAGFPGGDPLVVRIGNSTFALRRAEAACVRVEPA